MSRSRLGYVSSTNIGTVVSSLAYGVATGGTPTDILISSVSYKLLTFNTDANLTVSTAGLFDVLAVGGGGGGARSDQPNRGGGGGGGGDVVGLDKLLTIFLNAGTYAVDIGAAGASGAYSGNAGADTTLDGNLILATGGQAGVSCDNAISGPAFRLRRSSGGSGGGVAFNDLGVFPCRGFKVNAGGVGPVDISTAPSSAGGGGGAGSAGGAASGTTGGAGGNGANIGGFINVGTLYAAAGGGGAGTGAQGAAGLGGVAGNVTVAPTTNGSGGSGAQGTAAGSAGFQGILYIRFKQ